MATEAIVSFVAERLANLLIEEARLLRGARRQVKSLETELTRMQCFLKDFDAKQQKGDRRVRNWVAEIIDVSYDAEDVIDTYILNEIARIAQRRRRGLVAYVKTYLNELTTRHKVGKEIQRIKLKIGGISSSLSTYGIKDINDGGDEMRNLNIRRRASALYEEPDIIGMQESMITLMEQLMNDEARRCVISIVGMGGSGKTTLAKKVFHDVKDNFECQAFIYLSQQYGIRDVLIRIVEGVMRPSQEEKKDRYLNEEDLMKKIRDHLNKKRYLVVIDDIWTMQAWDELKLFLPDGLTKSRVLLTTRNKEVALHADKEVNHYYIRLLNGEESWDLFQKKIFPRGVVCPLVLMETGKRIVAKCQGLPLAIVVLGGLLSRREKTFGAWSRVLDGVTWHLAGDSNRCMEILALSYYDLPHYLKSCFLYLGIFPEDYEIKSKELIRLWVAEGFIPQRDNEIEEDVAEDFLEEMIGRSMIQVARRRSNGTVSTCRIHDLLRDLSISEAREVNFFGIYGDSGTTSSPSSLRRVALHRNVDEAKNINCSTAKLRSILYFSDFSIDLQTQLNKGGRLLRVVHIDTAYIKAYNLPEDIGEEVHLRYLKVNRIQRLPFSVNSLSNLHFLILPLADGTLPSAIWDLKRLGHLYAYGCEVDGHPQFSNFRNLRTLCLKVGSWIKDDLDKLTNLRKLGINGDSSSHHKVLSDAIEKWSNLRSLSLRYSTSIPPLVSLAHHQNLYKIYLSGHIENLPEMPPDLAKLTLIGSRLQQNAIEILEKLQNLRVLKLRYNSYYSEKMICSSGGFPRLESLDLDCAHIKDWTVEEGAMKSLKEVILYRHGLLEPLPKQVKDLMK